MCEALGRHVTGCLIVIPAHADYAVWLLEDEMCEALGLWRKTSSTETYCWRDGNEDVLCDGE